MSESERIDGLEKVLRQLARDVARLSREVRELRGEALAEEESPRQSERQSDRPIERAAEDLPVRVLPMPAPGPGGAAGRRPGRGNGALRAEREDPAAWRTLSIETLVGRYGAFALASVAILLGVGVFLSWAIEHVRLGPAARVALGAALAATVAVLGGVLRRRGARRFGNVMLGLALAVAHVVAWGAGPALRVVSPTVALAAAAAASIALAALAWRENEEALFAVGAGGALLAPFVTSGGSGRMLHLLGFGLLVISSGVLAIRDRAWRVSARILLAGAALYVFAGLRMADLADPLHRSAPAMFALACAWCVIGVAGDSHRMRMGRLLLALATIAAIVPALSNPGILRPELIALAVAITLSAHGLLVRTGDEPAHEGTRVAIVIPLGALAAAVLALAEPASPAGASLGALWLLIAVAAARVASGARRGAHLVVVAFAGAAAIVLGLHDRPVICLATLSMFCAALTMLQQPVPSAAAIEHRPRFGGLSSTALAATLFLLLAGASMWAGMLLVQRPAFAYPPFLTGASAAAAAVAAAWWAFSLTTAREPFSTRFGAMDPSPLIVVRLVAPAITFAWGYLELARAFSPDLSTFLVIAYVAAAGVLAIVLGRARAIPEARHLGLALAIIAGLRGLWQANALDVGLRLASYLVVGAFLLGVAYLYRATAERPDERPGASHI
ncbi:MAG TPA: DUF2339 domain-containing protein [Gemmatimonadaceae bacterium]|nr:DUF2339 domain-containing protein [Gemmatimonadaceae bacterium]